MFGHLTVLSFLLPSLQQPVFLFVGSSVYDQSICLLVCQSIGPPLLPSFLPSLYPSIHSSIHQGNSDKLSKPLNFCIWLQQYDPSLKLSHILNCLLYRAFCHHLIKINVSILRSEVNIVYIQLHIIMAVINFLHNYVCIYLLLFNI